MSLLQSRNKNNDNLILERRFIRTVLKEEADEILKAQTKKMNASSFSSRELFTGRKVDVSDTILAYTHLARHRFIDMKRRRSAKGVQKKKSYPIHNRILFGFANNIVRRLSVGFTEEVRSTMRNIEK